MTSGPSDLYEAGLEYLNACSAALETTDAGAITYQVLWQGLPPYDCVPALFVHAGGPSVGDTYPLQPPLQPMQRLVTTGEVILIQFTATVLRCAPTLLQHGQTVRLPDPATTMAAAKESMDDVWAIWNYCKTAHRDGSLFQSASGRREFMFQPATPIRTSGGAQGWEIPISVQLGGY